MSYGDGVAVLSSGSTRVVVDVHAGGRLTSLVTGGREVLGGSADPAVPPQMRSGCFPMAPFAGRLADGRVTFDGRSWNVPANLGDAAAHGVVFDVPWALEHVDDAVAVLAVELDARWPFGGSAHQVVRALDDGVAVALTVANDRRPMPAALGLHPWFARTRDGSDAVVEVAVPSDEDLPRRPWDLCLPGCTSPPTASWPGWRLVIDADTTTWTIYEQDPDAFCLEPLTHPVGAVASGAGGVVEPGHPLTLSTQIRLVPDERR